MNRSEREAQIRRRALRAARAATLGGMLVGAAACNEDPPATGGTDDTAGADAADGTSSDVETDTPDDAESDVETDAETDAAEDTNEDVAADTPVDAEPDTAEDTAEDVAMDSSEDGDLIDIVDDPETDVPTDVPTDADADVAEDTAMDVSDADDAPDIEVGDTDTDVGDVICKDAEDGLCPETCTVDNDYDCCVIDPLCFYDPDFGCGCAVPGPFVPPAMVA